MWMQGWELNPQKQAYEACFLIYIIHARSYHYHIDLIHPYLTLTTPMQHQRILI